MVSYKIMLMPLAFLALAGFVIDTALADLPREKDFSASVSFAASSEEEASGDVMFVSRGGGRGGRGGGRGGGRSGMRGGSRGGRGGSRSGMRGGSRGGRGGSRSGMRSGSRSGSGSRIRRGGSRSYSRSGSRHYSRPSGSQYSRPSGRHNLRSGRSGSLHSRTGDGLRRHSGRGTHRGFRDGRHHGGHRGGHGGSHYGLSFYFGYPYYWYYSYPYPYYDYGRPYGDYYYYYESPRYYYPAPSDEDEGYKTDEYVDEFADVRAKLEKQRAEEAPKVAARLKDIADVYRNGDYAEAMNMAESAVKAYPYHPVLEFVYSQSLFANGRYDRSADMLREAVRKTDIRSEVIFGLEFYPSRDELIQKIAVLREASQSDPGDGDLQLVLGYQLAVAGDYDEASRALAAAKGDYVNAPAAARLEQVLADKAKAAR